MTAHHIHIEVKKLRPHAIVPAYGSKAAAGLDLFACIDEPVIIHQQAPAILIPTGVAINMGGNRDIVGLIFPRSGLGHKKGLVLGNGTGVIDADYQGELFMSAWNRNPEASCGADLIGVSSVTIYPGDRIAQIVFLPIFSATFQEVATFENETERGAAGFGSTGV